MSHPAPRVIADDDLQTAVLGYIRRMQRRKVVPTNRIVQALQTDFAGRHLSEDQLVNLVKEAAICLGLVPVFDPELPSKSVGYGYGYPAHRPDPDGTYAFEPGPSRVLRKRTDSRWRVAG